MDAYRLDSTPEAEELDLESMMAQGALIIEWPERIRDLIPEEHLWIQFEHTGEEERQLRFQPQGKRPRDLVSQIREAVHGVR